MSFVSPQFILFFVVVVLLYFSTPYRWRWVLILISSYFFYMNWNASYIVLITFSTSVDFFAARQIAATDPANQRRRKLLLITSMTINLGILFIFKYFNFFNDSIAGVLTSLNIAYSASALNVLLPVGISFYTFQSMSYTIDVYRGDIKAEKNLGIYASYVAFFPQLVAGPIERASNIIPQFHEKHDFDAARVIEGLQILLWGAFKKIVIADRLALYVNQVYTTPQAYDGLTLITATVFFAFQIYCDFSGYSDMAVGAAKVMGFDLMQNFRQPYFSRSIREFWRRWHISLSTWFRDYLFIPLGGSRVPFRRSLINLMIVFVVSGLWHGAAWTFVAWGALHGAFIVIENIAIKKKFSLLPAQTPALITSLLQLALTFVLVDIAWVFFRAEDINDAIYIITHFFNFTTTTQVVSLYAGDPLGANTEFALSIGLIGFLIFIDVLNTRWSLHRMLAQNPAAVRWVIYYAFAIVISLSILFRTSTPDFIYFQF